MPLVELDPVTADGLTKFVLGTFNGSQPGVGATPPIDMLEVEHAVPVRLVPPGLGCAAPVVAEVEGTAVLGVGLTWGLVWEPT